MSRHELQIRLFGPMEVLGDGGPIDLPPSRKARALLAYLVATGRPHGRSALCDLFWNDVNDPRAGLRWALSKVRAVVDGNDRRRIVSSRDRIEFDLEQAAVDVHRVTSAVRGSAREASLATLEEAARAFRGEFLEGIDLPRCHEYQAWCLGMRERLRRHHLAIRTILVERLRKDPDAALPHALARLRMDALSEAAYIAAMDVLGRLGRVERGLELYEQCRRMLSRDLGIPASAELEAARRRLRHPAGPPPPPLASEGAATAPAESRATEPGPEPLAAALADLPAPRGLPVPGPDEPPLVGRSGETRRLVEISRAAGTGQGTTAILITGEPGIGKTRLLRELVREVRSGGGWVLAGPVFETEEIRPYGPWTDLIRSLPSPVLSRDLAQDLSALLVDPDPRPGGDAPVARAQLFEAVARLLGNLAEARGPGLVVLDDVQWLDASSSALLHYVARTLSRTPLLFGLAAREEEMDEGSPPARTVASLEDEGLLARICLERLDASQTGSLARAVDAEADLGRIFAVSEGNPLFVLAMTASLKEGTERTPSTIEEELSDRLERLERGALSLLPWAAALGRAFDVPTLVRVVERPAAEIVEAVDHLERRGILRATGPDRYDFTHSLLRRAAYRRLSEPVRREIHRSIARTLDDHRAREGREPASVAHHAEVGGLPELAARCYLEAAEHSLWLFALDEAAAQVARGLAQLPELSEERRIPLEMELLRVYGFRSMRDRRPEGLERRVRRVTDEARRMGLPAVVAVGHAVLMELEYQRGAFHAAARSSVRSAEAGRESGPAIATRALAETAACLLLLDQAPEDARRLASEAFALAEEQGAELDVVALAAALLHHHDGELEDASKAFQEVVRLGRRAQDRWWEGPALTRMIMVELDRGNLERALAGAREAEELAERLGDETEAAFARGLGAVASASLRGKRGSRGADALEAVDDALCELRVLDSLWTIGHLQAYAAELELAWGRPNAARRRAEEAARAGRTLDQPSLLTLARSLLAQSAVLEGSGGGAAVHLDPQEAGPSERRLSDRARRALRRAREAAP